MNDEVNRLVNACLSGTQVGRDGVPDLLTLSYYAGNYDHKPNSEYGMEIQDMYVRLDNSLGDLLDLIDRKVGLRNTLFSLLQLDIPILNPPILYSIRFQVENFISSDVLHC